MRRFLSVATVGLLAAVLWTSPAPAQAGARQQAQPTARVQISAPATAKYRTSVRVTGRLLDATGQPVAGQRTLLQRRVAGSWRTLTSRVSDAQGRVGAQETAGIAYKGRNLVARWKVDEPGGVPSRRTTVDLEKQQARLHLRGPRRLVDEHTARMRVRGVTGHGDDVLGRVTVRKRTSSAKRWSRVRVRTLRAGKTRFAVRPRVDTTYRVSAPARWWYSTPRGDRNRVNNVPPGRVVHLPSAAPRPRVKLPDQSRAVRGGLNPRVTGIGNRVWASMTGRTWHRGCPVGRGGLRIIRLNYWGFDGYRHRGEMVVNADVTSRVVGVFHDLYRARQPVRAMFRVDRFGRSDRLDGGNDFRSMAADNTSAFNCRRVVGAHARLSPHSFGRSIDLNPWENPDVTRHGTFPDRWWVPRTRPGVMVHRSSSHPVVRAFSRHGFAWGASFSDFHHFER